MTELYRGIERALAVLTALNRSNSSSVTELSRRTSISRPALYRILGVLVEAGYVRRRSDDRTYCPTSKVRTLSDGFRDDTSIYEIAAPILAALQREVVWPTDLAVYRGDRLELLETTRRQSPFVIDDLVAGGQLSSIFTTALGLAFLAHARPAERDAIIERYATKHPELASQEEHGAGQLLRTLDTVRAQRFAWRYRGSVKETGTIAVAVLQDGYAVASIGITFIAAALSVSEVVKRHLASLEEAAHAIGSALEAGAIDVVNSDDRTSEDTHTREWQVQEPEAR